mgnify:CR=1 FL=1
MRVLLCLVVSLAPFAATAQSDAPRTKTLSESLDEDYRQRPGASHPGSVKGGGVAFFPGFLVHGLGHLYIDEDASGYWLMGAGFLGAGLYLAEGMIDRRRYDAAVPNLARRIIGHEAMVLFMGSWLADMAGSLKGSAPFAESALPLRRSSYAFSYRYVGNASHSFYHRACTKVAFDWERFYFETDLELHLDWALEFRGIGLDTGARIIRGRNPRNHLAIGLAVRREEDRRHGVAASEFLPYVQWQADVGTVIRSLRNLYLVSRLGYGLTGYQFSSRPASVPALVSDHDFIDQWLFLETGFSLNPSPSSRMGVFLAMDPSVDVVASQIDFDGKGRLQIELVRLEFEYRHLQLDWSIGAGMSLNVGLEFDL